MLLAATKLCALVWPLPLLFVLTLASGAGENQMDTATTSGVVIIGKVTGASPLPSRETASRKRWSISIQVVRIVQGLPCVKIGDTATVQVHSVVKTFGENTSEVVGKSYRITYDGKFAKDYDGDLSVIAEPETEAERPPMGRGRRKDRRV